MGDGFLYHVMNLDYQLTIGEEADACVKKHWKYTDREQKKTRIFSKEVKNCRSGKGIKKNK